MVLFLDNFNLARFIRRQATTYQRALEEIKNGKKQSCWMWYVFPQLKGLGKSLSSQVFGISGEWEAQAYLAHPVLGPRLIECCSALLSHKNRSAEDIFGETDAMKLHSSMTLFASVSGRDSIFRKVLCEFFGGAEDQKTISILNKNTI